MEGMKDEAFVQELLAILTNPHPRGTDPGDPYGLAEDGIDRYDGFGRDVWVESLKVADGQHGAELIVEFGLELSSEPDFLSVPPSGAVRLPFDAQWRELSGYLAPAAYAPVVAREVESAAYRQVERHRRRPVGPPESDQGQAVLPSREAQWQILVDALRHQGPVRQVAPGRMELQHSGVVVTVAVTAAQWERVLTDHAKGDVDLYLDELLGPREEDETFVVFYNGDLARSTREQFPPVRSRAWERMIQQARAEEPDAQGACWRDSSDRGTDPASA